jgi:hypothetical protein
MIRGAPAGHDGTILAELAAGFREEASAALGLLHVKVDQGSRRAGDGPTVGSRLLYPADSRKRRRFSPRGNRRRPVRTEIVMPSATRFGDATTGGVPPVAAQSLEPDHDLGGSGTG